MEIDPGRPPEFWAFALIAASALYAAYFSRVAHEQARSSPVKYDGEWLFGFVTSYVIATIAAALAVAAYHAGPAF